MVGPGLVGAWLDHRWGTTLCTPAGFLIGMALAATALVVIAKNLTPPAFGKPLPRDDEPADDEFPAGGHSHTPTKKASKIPSGGDRTGDASGGGDIQRDGSPHQH